MPFLLLGLLALGGLVWWEVTKPPTVITYSGPVTVSAGQSLTVNVKVGSSYSFVSSAPANPITGGSATSNVANVFDGNGSPLAPGTFYAQQAGTCVITLSFQNGASATVTVNAA
jgi:hypothetical protein